MHGFKFKLGILVFLFGIGVICLTGCTDSEKELLDEKISSELKFIETNLFDVVYKYASGEYEEDILNEDVVAKITELTENKITIDSTVLEMKVIDFDKVGEDVKKINNSLDVLLIDLTEKNIDKSLITDVSQDVNNLIVNVSQNNINVILRDINEIEKSIINNIDKLSIKESEKKIQKVKADILNVFVNCMIYEDKTSSKEIINNLIDKYQEYLNDQEFVSDNKYLVNNIYVLLQELKTAVELENNELIKVKYLNLIEIL